MVEDDRALSKPGRVDLGMDDAPSIVRRPWFYLGLCWWLWGHCEAGLRHACLSSRAVPHECVCARCGGQS